MDVLSSVMNAMRTGRPVTYRIECRAPWGQRFPQLSGVGLHVLLRGSCWLMPTGGSEPLALEMGDVVLLPHGHAHSMADSPDTPLADADGRVQQGIDCTPDGQAVVLGDGVPGAGPTAEMLCGVYPLDTSRRHPVMAELPDAIRLAARLGRHPELRAAVDLLAGELASPQLGAHALRSSLFDAVLMYGLRAWYDEQCTEPGSWGAALVDPVVGAALQLMHSHPERPWTVESLGARAGLSRAAFARRFAGLVGQSPLAYLTWWRMSLAARLLRETETQVAEVAERTGYSSEFALAGAFRREYGTSPARYRRSTAPAAAS